MSEIDEMALAGSASSLRKNTEIPLTVSSLIDKSVDFLTSETISISRSSSVSSTSMGAMGNVGSNNKNGSTIIKSSASSQRQQHHHQYSSSDSPGKSNNSNIMSPLNLSNNENGQVLTENTDNTEEKTSVNISRNEDKELKFDMEIENENSISDTFYTPSASIQNLSSQLTSTSGIGGSESELNVSINSVDSIFEDGESDNNRNFEINQFSSELNGSKGSIEISNIDGSLMNSMTSELTVSMDLSTTSKESSSSSSSKEALQPGVYNTKLPTKKRMWYHVFQPSYKARSSDFKKYFKDLPAEERLIVDYSCALQRDILVQGRMYISQSYISFHANIFGWETLTCIRMKDVTSITKEKTALVIPNAVQICTINEKFFFASFVGRDATFMMLFKLWQTSLLQEKSMPLKQVWQLVHSCYGEIGSEEEDEDYLTVAPGNQILPSILLSNTSNSNNDDKDNKSIEIDQGSENGLDTSILSDHIIASRSSTLKAVNGHSSGVAESDSSDSDEEILHVPVEDLYVEIPVCPVSHTQGVEVVNTTVSCDVDQLFTMLFTKSKFYWDFHTTRKTFNIVQGDWEQNLGETKKVRQVSFTVTLNNPMGPKHSQVTETQVLLPESKPGCLYAIDAESVNAGIPYEDSFYVTCHFCLSRILPHESKLVIISQVKYKKSVNFIIKPFIEKNSWAGIKEFYSHLEQAIKEECAKVTVLSHSPAPSARINGPIHTVIRRRKGKAPAPPCVTSVSTTDNESIPSNGAVLLSNEDENISSHITVNSPIVFKATLTILAALLLLNAYLFIKLIRLETAANASSLFQAPPTFTKEIPQNHQEWLLLLQHQEALHRVELHKWHEILVAALQILHQAESDLELLTLKISSYSERRFTIGLKPIPNPEISEVPISIVEQQEVKIESEEEQNRDANTKFDSSSSN